MNIPFLDFQRQYAQIKPEVQAAVQRVLDRQHFILGPEVELFEKQLAHYMGVKYVISVNSGTDALIFALRALGIKKGDEVITPVNSFIATTLAITEVGATPIFVDINPDTYETDVNTIEQKITPNTKAILPVHLYGSPCEIDKISAIAKKHNLYLIEDNAQAIGATWDGEKVGTFGDICIYSFYPGKNLGAYGDGGALSTNNEEIYQKLCMLRNYGQSKKYHHDYIGINSRMDEIQAAVLQVKLNYIDTWNEKRREHAAQYNKNFAGKVKTQIIPPQAESNYHLFIIEVENRDKVQAYLEEKGIHTLIHYPIPIHLQKCYSYLGYKQGDFPLTEKNANNILSIPMYPELTTEEINYISKIVLETV